MQVEAGLRHAKEPRKPRNVYEEDDENDSFTSFGRRFGRQVRHRGPEPHRNRTPWDPTGLHGTPCHRGPEPRSFAATPLKTSARVPNMEVGANGPVGNEAQPETRVAPG